MIAAVITLGVALAVALTAAAALAILDHDPFSFDDTEDSEAW